MYVCDAFDGLSAMSEVENASIHGSYCYERSLPGV